MKYTVKLQVPPATIDPLHGGLPELEVKSGLLTPAISAPVMYRVVVPTLVTVTVEETCVPFLTVPSYGGNDPGLGVDLADAAVIGVSDEHVVGRVKPHGDGVVQQS